jgi:uncharacterized membrane protein
MNTRFFKIYTVLKDSFWFLPALMAVGAGTAALGTITIDHVVGNEWLSGIIWVWSGSAEGARSVLAVIAGSVMTVVSIVYSLTITTLAQTSSHYGPRVLRNFTSDRGNQIVLGTFLATFIYCLLVLRTINSEDDARFVPFLSVNIGVVLALISLGVLIYFIHHISQSIQAENLISGIGHPFQKALPQLFPRKMGIPEGESQVPDELKWRSAYCVQATRNGCILALDSERLMHLATEHDLIIKTEKRPGSFVIRESVLLRALPAENMSDHITKELLECYSWGIHRTPHQDVMYSIQQLVEIAAHALSPGINEPFTAITCIDWLGASLRGIAREEMPSSLRHEKDGKLRVIVSHITFDDMVHASFDQIRHYGSENPAVMIHLMNTVEELAAHLQRTEDCDVLLSYLELVGQDTQANIRNKEDLKRVTQARFQTRDDLLAQRAKLSADAPSTPAEALECTASANKR